MDIIVLQELPNKGKTTTINLVYSDVLNNGGISTHKQNLGGDPKDFSDIVINYLRKRIAFFSMGDNSTALANAIYYYDSQNCDLIICTLSTGTPKVRANTALNHFSAHRINKTVVINPVMESQANSKDAQTIFNLIQ